MKIKGRRVFVTEVVCDSVQLPKPQNSPVILITNFNGIKLQDYGQGFGGQQSGQTNPSIISSTRNDLIIHLQMQTTPI